MRIFAPSKKGYIYWSVNVLNWGNLAFYASVWLALLFECIPHEKIWNYEYEGGRCININAAYLTSGIFNVVSDFLILLLPLLAIWRLRLALKRKVGVSAVFATGVL